MNSDASGTVVGFSDPPNIPETALFSFNPLVFLYFMLAFYFVPYPLYRYVAHKLDWELNTKTPARHWSDTMFGCSYGVILFVFGNYSHCFSWITVVAFYPALFGYGLIAELPFTKTSLPNIRNWPMGMWVVFLTALGIILAFAAFHIYIAATLTIPFVAFYVCGLIIPAFFFALSIFLVKEVNNNWARTKYHAWRAQKRLKKETASAPANVTQDEKTEQDIEANGESSQQPVPPPHADEPEQPLVNPYNARASLHLHHWQIFYTLAFFTRFTHPVSQVASGIVLACYMEGICAYGYDCLVNDD
ncbi:hypothetical protein DM01DRAFT_1335506 [Hesseltinella vesiculosa]|uniref:Uncharacterized protein n=1 Tax=Hesseltinella vesiculosa TaxID=101127 RepID=A0A1X2GJS1_9FUNG|nr:hypothetical protein DM01DRAFT_1335506 [Hesseltinella vesiculosa]